MTEVKVPITVVCNYGRVVVKPVYTAFDGEYIVPIGGGAVWYDELGRVLKETTGFTWPK